MKCNLVRKIHSYQVENPQTKKKEKRNELRFYLVFDNGNSIRVQPLVIKNKQGEVLVNNYSSLVSLADLEPDNDNEE